MTINRNGSPHKKLICLQYIGHIAAITGTVRESLLVEGIENISDLLLKLDQKHPGMKETFMPPGGVFNSRTAIVLRRIGQPTFGVVREDEKVHDGDVLTLW